MALSSILLTGVFAFSIVCIVAVLFFERKNPASSLVWVLVLLFLPVAGFVFYLFLGSGFRVSKRKKYALKAIADDLYNNHLMQNLSLGRTQIFLKDHAASSRLLTYLKNQSDGVFTDNNQAEVFVDGNDMFARMLADLEQAQSHIHILFYIFRHDNLGKKILTILTEKAKNGVEVRLMYDSIGTLMASDAVFRPLKKAGGEVIAFSPIFSSLNSHLRLNYRNHRKIVVIDGQIGYVGGRNVGDEYCGQDPKLCPWRDSHLRFTGSAVWFLQGRFFMDWTSSLDTDLMAEYIAKYFPKPIDTGTLPMQIISSGPDTQGSPIKSGMLSMMYGARKYIHIQTPYFSPDESITDALRIAASANVDVRLMIPARSDYRIVHMATMGYVRDMQEFGVKIHSYDGFIHAKTIVVDDEVATIGTTNLTNRSFTLDFEINAFIYDQAFAGHVDALFQKDMEYCTLLEENYFAKQNALVRAGYNFARMLAPMM